ncbi:hypothetical protein ACOMHN_063410 [Nucella lapillus]
MGWHYDHSAQCPCYDRTVDKRSDRSGSPLTSKRGLSSNPNPETKILPLSSFREPENRRLYANMKMAMNDNSGLHPYFGDKVHQSSLKRTHHSPGAGNNMSSSSSSSSSSHQPFSHGGGGGSYGGTVGDRTLTQRARPSTSSGRQVTFAHSTSLPRSDLGRKSPRPPAYEHLLPDGAGTYTSFSRGIDDEDGETIASGGYMGDSVDDHEDTIS